MREKGISPSAEDSWADGGGVLEDVVGGGAKRGWVARRWIVASELVAGDGDGDGEFVVVGARGEGIKTKDSTIPRPDLRRSSISTIISFPVFPLPPFRFPSPFPGVGPELEVVKPTRIPSLLSSRPKTGGSRDLSRNDFWVRVCVNEEMVKMAVERYRRMVRGVGV